LVQVEQVVAGYRSSYCTAGDIDELDFLSHEDYLVIPSLAERLACTFRPFMTSLKSARQCLIAGIVFFYRSGSLSAAKE